MGNAIQSAGNSLGISAITNPIGDFANGVGRVGDTVGQAFSDSTKPYADFFAGNESLGGAINRATLSDTDNTTAVFSGKRGNASSQGIRNTAAAVGAIYGGAAAYGAGAGGGAAAGGAGAGAGGAGAAGAGAAAGAGGGAAAGGALGGWGPTLVGVGGSLLGGALGGQAATDAAQTQAEAADRASANSLTGLRESNALQQKMYDQNRTDQTPWRDAGTNALSQLQTGMADGGQFNKKFTMADFQADPSYQFGLDEGNRGIEQSAAARGGVLSGATMKALNRFGINTANGEYGNQYNRFETNKANQFNRLSGIAGTGQTSVNQTGQAGSNMANGVSSNNANGYGQISSNIIGAGNASAAGKVGQANAWSNVIGQGVNMYNQNNMLNKMYAPSGSRVASSGSYANNDYLTS